jgi:hypothetical protein
LSPYFAGVEIVEITENPSAAQARSGQSNTLVTVHLSQVVICCSFFTKISDAGGKSL